MNLFKIRTIVENHFKIDLETKGQSAKYTVPRTIFFVLSKRYTREKEASIGNYISFSERVTNASEKNLEKYLKEFPSYELSYNLLLREVGKNDRKITKTISKSNLRESEIAILKSLSALSDRQVSEFTETRLKPYLKMLQSNERHKAKVIQPAKRNHIMTVR